MPNPVELWPTVPSGIHPIVQKLTESCVTVVKRAGALRLIVRKQSVETEATGALRPVQIIGREWYSEQHKNYPALSAKALKAVLAQEHTGKSVLHLTGPLLQGGYQVTSYILSAELQSELTSGFWLPESVVLGYARPGQVLAVQVGAQRFFCCRWNNHCYSALHTAICPDAERFKMIQGLPADLPVLQCDEAQYARYLAMGLPLLPLQVWAESWFRRQKAISLNFRLGLAVMLIGWAGYLGLVSGWLHLQQSRIAQKAELMGPKVNELLELQKQFEQSAVLQQNIADSFRGAVYPEQLSLLVLELSSRQVKVERLQLKSGVVELTARAAKATDALSTLQKLPFVASAAYSNATRRVGDMEQFSVTVQFNSGATGND